MRVGLYGKLPAKRDFVAHDVARPFLAAWEPWLQAGVATSRLRLGGVWRDAYLQAPLWRFWLGRGICGSEALGILMPSVDGVGRYFPLTLVAFAEPGEAILPPDSNPHEGWFAEAEPALLAALESGKRFEQVVAGLATLPVLEASLLCESAGRSVPLVGGWPAILDEARRTDPVRHAAPLSLFWTAGGGEFPATAHVRHGLPEPDLFGSMLTGSPWGGALCSLS